jgi:glucose-6-phosphate isomerase
MPTPLSSTAAWTHFATSARAASQRDTLRLIEAAGLCVDFSAQVDSEALRHAASELLAQQKFDDARRRLYQGDRVNWTENRAAWHMALRAPQPPAPIATEVLGERERVREFVRIADASNRYRFVLHLGIGGSDWGPRMVIRALRYGTDIHRDVRFASNVDAHALLEAIHGLDPRDTLVIVASKSFSTAETLANAAAAIEWLRQGGVKQPLEQFVAITSNVVAAQKFGVATEHIFKLWDWVGGRYSLWSAIGLPIALSLGTAVLDQLLAGAAAMDEHFLHTSHAANAPVQMALAGIVNRSVLGYPSLMLAPYDSRLELLVPWAQQLEMESLGKVATREGPAVGVPTGPVVWGLPGTDAQHTFFQWLHQDTQGAPVDFILCAQADHAYPRHHHILVANCLAQRAALLRGKTFEEALAETRAIEPSSTQAELLAHHRVHPGGRPSTLIVLPRLCAYSLGALLALYEHKVFVQGVIWGINPFDQWGVEYGKVLAQNIIRELDHAAGCSQAGDVSTQYWVDRLAK